MKATMREPFIFRFFSALDGRSRITLAVFLAITLIALSLFGKFFAYDRAVFVWTTALTLVGALYDFAAALPAPLLAACRLDGVLAMLRETLPLAKLGLFWVLPALLGLVIGLILHFVRSKANV